MTKIRLLISVIFPINNFVVEVSAVPSPQSSTLEDRVICYQDFLPLDVEQTNVNLQGSCFAVPRTGAFIGSYHPNRSVLRARKYSVLCDGYKKRLFLKISGLYFVLSLAF